MLKELNECIITVFIRRQNISTKSKIIEKNSGASPCQNTNGLLYRTRTIILKFVWKYKRLESKTPVKD